MKETTSTCACCGKEMASSTSNNPLCIECTETLNILMSQIVKHLSHK
jgi:hypothetical protein